jgi:hypothetical protein
VKGKEAALRIGQAAAQLGISPHHLRQLCKCGLVEAEQSPGGQWRIPMSEIRRLQSDGGPAAPTFIEDDPEPPAPAPLPPANRLLASPSPEMVYAVEDAEIEEAAVRKEEASVRRKESTVRKLRLELEEQEIQNQVDARRNRELAEAATQQAAARQLEEDRLHAAWVEEWAEYTLGGLSRDVPGPLRLALHNAIVNRLADMPRTQSAILTRQLIDAEKATVLAPWERQRALDKVVESVCGELPYELRSYEQNRVRKNQAAQAARAAIEQLGDVPEWQMKLAGTAATEPIVTEFEHEQRCAKLASTLPPGLTSDEQADARDQIQDALLQFPASTTQRKLEQARDEAFAPFRLVLAKREHERRRENLLFWVSLRLPSGLSSSDREKAIEEIRAAVAKLPVGSAEHDMEAARDRVVDGIRKKHEEQARIGTLIERGLREVHPYIQRLVQKGLLELEHRETAYSVAETLKKEVREALEDELEGTETEEDVKKLVYEIVRDEFDL